MMLDMAMWRGLASFDEGGTFEIGLSLKEFPGTCPAECENGCGWWNRPG